ncbi:hypothetical protein KM043_009233 [Ampulex compressa]|nr:hypothetical protein KM043_009233 [Ampulex compressa]
MGHQGIGLAAEEARSQVRANGGRREVEERGEVGCMLESAPRADGAFANKRTADEHEGPTGEQHPPIPFFLPPPPGIRQRPVLEAPGVSAPSADPPSFVRPWPTRFLLLRWKAEIWFLEEKATDFFLRGQENWFHCIYVCGSSGGRKLPDSKERHVDGMQLQRESHLSNVAGQRPGILRT